MFGDFLIYDTENSDLNTKFGQITQFGGVRLNSDLDIVEELSIDIRLLPWIVPGPEACKVTKTPPAALEGSERISEFNAAKQIFQFLTPRGAARTAYVTYNGSHHDDEYLRSMFFKNMLNPWFTSNRQITRIDLFPLIQLIHSVDENAINIPTTDEGKLSFRLEKICPENGIEIDAHDALHDSKGTRDLLKLIYKKAPWAIELAIEAGNTAEQTGMLENARTEGYALWLHTHFGAPDFVPVVPVFSPSKDRYFLFDLRCQDYRAALPEDDKLLFNGSPFHLVNLKKMPLFVDDAIVENAGIPTNDVDWDARAALVLQDVEFQESFALKAGNTSFPQPENPQMEEKMLPFWGWDTKKLMDKFTSATDWQSRVALRFSDKRAREFAARILYDAHLNGEVTLSEKLFPQIEDICAHLLNRPYEGPEARWTSLSIALKEKPDQEWLDWATQKYGEAAMQEAALLLETSSETENQRDLETTVSAPQMTFGF